MNDVFVFKVLENIKRYKKKIYLIFDRNIYYVNMWINIVHRNQNKIIIICHITDHIYDTGTQQYKIQIELHNKYIINIVYNIKYIHLKVFTNMNKS